MPTFGETLTFDTTYSDGELSPIHIALEHRISNQFEIFQLLITSQAIRMHVLYRLSGMRNGHPMMIYLHHHLLQNPIPIPPGLDERQLRSYLIHVVTDRFLF
jgi:hypothetical protein